jgi:hypothetical protein
MKPQNTRELLEDIANLLLEHEQEQRETILFEELERLCIYRSNCWDIINEERPTDFFIEEIGKYAYKPEMLAWNILYNRFMTDYSTLIY